MVAMQLAVWPGVGMPPVPPSRRLGSWHLCCRPLSLGPLSLQDTVLGACPPESSWPAFLPRIPERGADELELVAGELQALQEELRAAAEARRAAWVSRVRARELLA